MALADVPETTIKIVVSGTCGERERERETGKTKKRGQTKNEDMFWGAAHETTVFIVVSGPHTGVFLAHVPETTGFIVVSGTCGDEDEKAKKGTKKI